MRPHRRQPTRLPRPWDSPGKNTGVGCHFLLQCMKVKIESEVAQSCQTLSDPMDCSPPVSSVHGFSRQEYWSGVPLPPSNNRKGTQPSPLIENWIKDLLTMAPPIRTRPSVPLSQSLPSGSFHKPLILLLQRADRLKTTVTGN